MDDQVENLGKLSPWQIKEFPETLREEIAKQAKRERMTVGEFVAGHMLRLREAGWPHEGLPADGPVANRQTTFSLGDLERTITMACKVAEFSDRMPKGTASIAHRLVKDQLVAMRQTGKPAAEARRNLALAAPFPVEADGLQTVGAEPRHPSVNGFQTEVGHG